jgi:UDP-N-acetylmuramoyl-L-alanyl-D-glutamate--2,6-diaminopimelate ligase
MAWWQAAEGATCIGDVPEISELTHASGLVRPGWGFAAVPGRARDGHEFLGSVIDAGAAACVVQADREAAWAPYRGRVPLVVVPDVRVGLGYLAAAVYGRPTDRLRIVGVTGTDGKTTTAHLVAHVLARCGLDAGYLSSVGFDRRQGFEINAMHMTTLEATSIQSMLADAAKNGRQTMVVEASSEGLAQGRLNGSSVDVAVFTNLTRDHLDFHGTMERYLEAKGLLFRKLDEDGEKHFPRTAVLNADEPSSAYLRTVSHAPVITYGLREAAEFSASGVRTEGFGLRFRLSHGDSRLEALVPLIGEFNAYNSLAAVATAASQGVALEEAVEALSDFPGVPGRMERIDEGQPFAVFVDIASTGAAMENVLNALRPATAGRLWVVFGAAGGRDPARRGGLGAVVGRLADRAVITNEDPRHEDPDAIIEAIAQGLREGGRVDGQDFVRVPDRGEAIQYAFEHASPGDTVLLAGKATETTMIFAGGPVPWDERGVARELLRG